MRVFFGASAALALMVALVLLVPGASGAAPAREEAPPAAPQEEAPQEAAPPGSEPPAVEATAWILTDLQSGTQLEGENVDEPLPPASTVKIMVALMALEQDVDLEDLVYISPEAEQFVGDVFSNIGLIQGEAITVRDALEASLIPSGTEAVYALAEYLGNGNADALVDRMNERAAELGLENTSFADPAGLDLPENRSSARELAIIAREAMQYPLFREIVASPETTIEAIGAENREIEVFNTNNLIYTYPAATGIKTGTSPEAGPSLVASAEDGGESYIAVVLGAEGPEERFNDAQRLLEWTFNNYEREPLVEPEEPVEEIQVPFRRGETVDLLAAEEVSGLVGPASEVERRTNVGEPPPSAEPGEEIGEVEVLVDGEVVGASPLVAAEGYEEAGILDRVWFTVRGWFD